MLIDKLHQIFRNKIHFESKIIIICFIYQSIWMFISCSNDDMYYLLINNLNQNPIYYSCK